MEGSHNNRPFITTQHVNLRIGEATKSFPFTAISNSPFTQVSICAEILRLILLSLAGGV